MPPLPGRGARPRGARPRPGPGQRHLLLDGRRCQSTPGVFGIQYPKMVPQHLPRIPQAEENDRSLSPVEIQNDRTLSLEQHQPQIKTFVYILDIMR